jgi:hypothetical protein
MTASAAKSAQSAKRSVIPARRTLSDCMNFSYMSRASWMGH